MSEQAFFRALSIDLLNMDQLYLIAVSGGVDSMVLLHALKTKGFNVAAGHFDHQIRPESNKDLVFVEEYCAENEIPFHSGSGDVPGYSAANKRSLETAARELRYRFLFETAERIGAHGVVTGHQADDQAETVLLNLIRGAGISGLAGMQASTLPNAFSDKIPLIRPMLKMPRKMILDYAARHRIPYRVDYTNEMADARRNRIRLELLPMLSTFNPNIVTALTDLARVAGETKNFLLDEVAKVKGQLITSNDAGVTIDRGISKQLPTILVLETIKRSLQEQYPDAEDITQERIENLVELIRGGKSQFALELGDHINAAGRKDSVRITKGETVDSHVTSTWQPIQLTLQGDTQLPYGWVLQTQKMSERPKHIVLPPDEAYFDLTKAGTDLHMRPVTLSDSFIPFGRDKFIGVMDYLKRMQIPTAERKLWPVLLAGNDVVWVVGLRADNRYRVDDSTRTMLHVKVLRPS